MKVIDEKGKLFGKLNIIDLLVIIFVIAAVIVVGMKFLGGEDEVVSTTRLTYTVRVTAQSEQVAERVAEYVDTASGKRDQLMANDLMVDAYIIDYWTEPTAYHKMSNGTVEIFDADTAEAGLVDICFVIEANVANTLMNEVGTQQVRIGKDHIVKTTHLEFANGTVENCVWEAQ